MNKYIIIIYSYKIKEILCANNVHGYNNKMLGKKKNVKDCLLSSSNRKYMINYNISVAVIFTYNLFPYDSNQTTSFLMSCDFFEKFE